MKERKKEKREEKMLNISTQRKFSIINITFQNTQGKTTKKPETTQDNFTSGTSTNSEKGENHSFKSHDFKSILYPKISNSGKSNCSTRVWYCFSTGLEGTLY